jgi:hypothetical protein
VWSPCFSTLCYPTCLCKIMDIGLSTRCCQRCLCKIMNDNCHGIVDMGLVHLRCSHLALRCMTCEAGGLQRAQSSVFLTIPQGSRQSIPAFPSQCLSTKAGHLLHVAMGKRPYRTNLGRLSNKLIRMESVTIVYNLLIARSFRRLWREGVCSEYTSVAHDRNLTSAWQARPVRLA